MSDSKRDSDNVDMERTKNIVYFIFDILNIEYDGRQNFQLVGLPNLINQDYMNAVVNDIIVIITGYTLKNKSLSKEILETIITPEVIEKLKQNDTNLHESINKLMTHVKARYSNYEDVNKKSLSLLITNLFLLQTYIIIEKIKVTGDLDPDILRLFVDISNSLTKKISTFNEIISSDNSVPAISESKGDATPSSVSRKEAIQQITNTQNPNLDISSSTSDNAGSLSAPIGNAAVAAAAANPTGSSRREPNAVAALTDVTANPASSFRREANAARREANAAEEPTDVTAIPTGSSRRGAPMGASSGNSGEKPKEDSNQDGKGIIHIGGRRFYDHQFKSKYIKYKKRYLELRKQLNA